MRIAVQELRQDKGISMNELARRAGVSPGTVHSIETGKNEDPSIRVLFGIAKALEVSLDTLVCA
jgi:transcriptional regulator with XRE-family HTH domain